MGEQTNDKRGHGMYRRTLNHLGMVFLLILIPCGVAFAGDTGLIAKTDRAALPSDLPMVKDSIGNTGDLSCPGEGSPVWSVNKINLNLYVTDTPIWYKPPYGPSVSIKMSYNSLTPTVPNSPFGSRWQSNYTSYIIENGSTVTVVMPDGREDVYTANGGTYTNPFGVFNTLTKVSDKRYTVTFLDGTVNTYAIPLGTTLTTPMLIEIRDAHNQPVSIDYDTSGRIWKIRDVLNRETVFSYYSGTNLVQTVTDPFGRSATFEYNGTNIQKVTDIAGFWASYTYDANGFMSSITTQKGVWLFNIEQNDAATNPAAYPDPNAAAPKMGKKYRVTITNPDNPNGTKNKEEYFYDGSNTWYVSPRDYVAYQDTTTNNMNNAAKTYYIFDRSMAKGRISTVISPEGRSQRFTFDPVTGQQATVTDGNNRVTTYTYNTNGLVASIKDPKGILINFTYYTNNIDVHTVANSLGTITYEYIGAPHDITAMIDRMNIRTEYAYNNLGQLTTVTEAKGNTLLETTTQLIYDPVKFTLMEIRESGNLLSSLDYDNIGRMTNATYPEGVSITYEYEGLNQIKKITYPDFRTETVVNSTVCPHLVDSITDRGGITTSYIYDAMKRLKQLTGPSGTFKYDYDSNGNMTTFTDSGNKITKFDYDKDNKLSKKTYDDTTKYVSYTYDFAGNLKTFTNSRNGITTYSYDDADGNMTQISYPYGTGTPTANYTYDDYNRVQSRTDGIGTWNYTYDSDDRLKTIDGPWDNDTITFDYDDLNRIKTMTPQGGTQVTYGYTDPLGRLKTITKGADSFTYNYVGNSSLVNSLLRPRGVMTQYQYNDPLKKLTSVINYNPLNQIISQYDYTYNTLDLKGSETVTNGLPIDNLVAGTANYIPNNLNQITSKTNPSQSFAYDADGNMTSTYTTPDGYQMALTYDGANRLIATQYTGQNSVVYKTTYDYSGDGLLAVMKKYENGSLVKTTRYVRAGFLPVQERDAGNNVTREYLWGKNMGGGIGGLLSLRQNGNDYYYLYDGKGNVTSLIDVNQTPVVAYAYDPFGVRMKITGTLDQPFQFSTKEYDAQTGLSYYGFRFYSPTLGRWMTKDPLGETADSNLYRFVGNSPNNFVDPLGLDVSVCFYTDNFGHVGFGASEDSTYGFYPTGNPLNSPGQVKADKQKHKQCKTIDSPPDKDLCMQICRDKRTATPGNYKVASQQCTSFVRDCLRECGLPTGDYTGPWPLFFYNRLPDKNTRQ